MQHSFDRSSLQLPTTMLSIEAFSTPIFPAAMPLHSSFQRHGHLLHSYPPLNNHRQSPKTLSSSTFTNQDTDPIFNYDEESRCHVITVPSFLPNTQINDDFPYPSPLHKIHVLPILSTEETSHLLALARNHANENKSWNQQDSSRHVSYPTVDFAIDESAEISEYLGNNGIKFQERIFGALSDAFDVDADDLSFLDLFCASYEAADGGGQLTDEEGRDTMDRLEFHRDGSLLSFTVLLTPPEGFEGGGTIFDALRDVHIDGTVPILKSPGTINPPEAGFATLHSGKLLHGGHVVTKGQRVVLVGFVSVDERNTRDGALGDATKEWGRNDVRLFWDRRRLSLLKKQQREGNNQSQPTWRIKNWRYLPKDTSERRSEKNEGRSYFGPHSIIPHKVLESIERRASQESIRKRRLITEDKMLREILLPRNERGEKVNMQMGEWKEVEFDMDGLILGWEEGNEGAN
mmetsp:Transcript_10764/g.22420  ORF Transcript_10764/g.22420 Transcript_10764/m.22420 type:complete len:461 (-) Transcript_10764:154-1536(-)